MNPYEAVEIGFELSYKAESSLYGHFSGWQVANVLKVVDSVLKRDQPEAAIIMIGNCSTRSMVEKAVGI